MIYNGLDVSTLTDNEVLFFVRIYGKKGIFGTFYPNIFLQEFSRLKKFRTISEYKVGDVYIDIKNENVGYLAPRYFEIFDKVLNIDEIIVRCRGLREISYFESRQLIWRVGKFFIDYYSHHRDLKLIVSLPVDNYVLDIMIRIAGHFNIKVIQLVGLFIPGYIRFINNEGMGLPMRDVEDTEVDEVYYKLINKERSHLAIDKSKAVKNAAKDYLSYYYRFWVRFVWRYKINGNLSYEHRFAPYLHGFHKLSKLFAGKYFDRFDKAKIEPSKSVFIPIHFHPEATVDYWTDRKEHADYLNSLIEVISFFREKGIDVVLKEHPNYYLRRSIQFYKILKSFDNTILLDPYIPSQLLFECTDNICVHTGSAGVEALMLNKRVYIISENYYSFGKIPHYKNFDQEYKFLNETEKKEIIKKILSCTIKLYA